MQPQHRDGVDPGIRQALAVAAATVGAAEVAAKHQAAKKRALATLCNFVKFRPVIRQRIADVFGITSDDSASARQAVAELGTCPVDWAEDFRAMVLETQGVDLDQQMTLTWFAGAVAAAHFAEEKERETKIAAAVTRLMRLVYEKTQRCAGYGCFEGVGGRPFFDGFHVPHEMASDAR